MRSIKKLSRWALYLTALISALFIIAVLAVRFVLFPNIQYYKDDIAAEASKAVGQRITIGAINTGWERIYPHIILKDVDVFDAENRSALHLNNLEANVSWLSLPLLEPRLSKLTIHQPKLSIRRKPDGSVYLAGIPLAGESKPEFSNWLLRQSKVEIENAQIVWLDELRKAPELSLDKLNLTLSNHILKSLFGRHKFKIEATPSIGTVYPIKVVGEFTGRDVSQVHTWRGNLETELKGTDLAVWRPWLDYPIDLKSGNGDTQIALSFANSKIEKISTHTTLTNLSITTPKQANLFVAKEFSGDIIWQSKNGVSVEARNINLETNNGLNIENGNGYYRSTERNGAPWVDASLELNSFDLSTLSLVDTHFDLPEASLTWLENLAPKGKLSQLRLSLQGNPKKPDKYRINTSFNGLSINAYQQVPGFSNLSGRIESNQDGGKLTLETQNAMLDLKGIMRWPIPIDRANGIVKWRVVNEKDVYLETKNMVLTNPHIRGTVTASYRIDGVKAGYLDLIGNFDDGNAKFAPFYYPIILGAPTLHWLDTSILSGRADDVKLVVKGRLADFPYVDDKNQLDQKLGLFRVTAKISGTELEYGVGWPNVQDLAVDMLFEGKRMELNSSKGHIYGNKILKSKTTIPKLDADSPMLYIVSDVEGPVSDGVKFVNESPVKLVTQGFTDDLKTSGAGRLHLELAIPMQDLEAAKYKGAYKINNGTIFSNPDVGLPELAKLNGTLSFTENSLTAQNVNAEILGGPAQFSLRSGSDKVLRVQASGRITDTGIRKLSANILTKNIQGSTDWMGELSIKKPLVNLNIRSNLLGMAVNLPEPIGKTASEEFAFQLDKKQQNETQDNINIRYGNAVSAAILRQAQNDKLIFDRGDIGLNMPAQPQNQPGLSLHGKFDYFDADEWLALMRSGDTAEKTTTPEISISQADLTIQKLNVLNRKINGLHLLVSPSDTGLKMSLSSQEISGDAEWQRGNGNNGKIIARLKNLIIPNSADTASAQSKSDIRKLAKTYPALDITADNFELGNKKLGTLSVNAFENNDDWVIQKLNISNPESTLNAEGNWHNWTRSPNTNLKFNLSINNIGRTLKRFGQPDTIKGGEGEIIGQLQWPGSPHEFDTKGLSGNFKLDAKKGQILKVQPGVGRLLGLLSLQSLPRRLTLDFRDLFSEGFAFDSVQANARINAGIMRSDDFFMTGPAAEVKIKGETNLKTETQHLNVKVTPHVSDSLSLAAFAGGPIAGVAAFVAQKILKDPFNKITSSDYVIVGTWDNPQEVKSEQDKTQQNGSALPNN